MLIAGLQFVGGAVLVILAGVTLTKNADTLGKTLGLSAGWAGILILPLATSLPELVSSLRAVLISAPDMAVGNIFGANMYNIFILGIVDIAYFPGNLLKDSSFDHLLTILMCIALTSLVAVGLANRSKKAVGLIGYDSIIIVIGYLIAVAMLFYMRIG